MSASFPAHPNVLSGARVLIFGGTTGIGQGVASAALANGAKVFVSSSNPDKVAAATAGMRETYSGAAVGGTAADLANGATIEANVEKVLQAAVAELGGPLDHIVWTAGDAFNQDTLANVTAENAFPPWNVRYLGPLMLAKHLSVKPGAYLKAESTSSITLTSGILGARPMKGLSRAVGWCGAIETMTRTLAVDLAPVRTNTVAPGAILTPMLEQLGQEAISGFASQHLVQKIGQPSEIAEAYLLSMRCAFVTGQLFTIDGGYTYK